MTDPASPGAPGSEAERVVVEVTRAPRFKLYPTREQQATLERWERALAWFWDVLLEQRMSAWDATAAERARRRANKNEVDVYSQLRELTALQEQCADVAEVARLIEVPRTAKNALTKTHDMAWSRFARGLKTRGAEQRDREREIHARTLERLYQRRAIGGENAPGDLMFRRRWVGMPRRKGPRDSTAIEIAGVFTRITEFDGRFALVQVPNLGALRVRLHWQPPEGAVLCRVVLTRSIREWWASISWRWPTPAPVARLEPVVGVNRGIGALAATSEGTIYAMAEHGERALDRLGAAQTLANAIAEGQRERAQAWRVVVRQGAGGLLAYLARRKAPVRAPRLGPDGATVRAPPRAEFEVWVGTVFARDAAGPYVETKARREAVRAAGPGSELARWADAFEQWRTGDRHKPAPRAPGVAPLTDAQARDLVLRGEAEGSAFRAWATAFLAWHEAGRQGRPPASPAQSARATKARNRAATIARRATRQREAVLHVVSRRLAESAGTLVFEEQAITAMTASRRGTAEAPGEGVAVQAQLNRRILGAAWGKLAEFSRYKITERGGACVTAPPAFISQECPRCGCVDERNHPSARRFRCVSCGLEAPSDVVAAGHLRDRYLASRDRPAPAPKAAMKLSPWGRGGKRRARSANDTANSTPPEGGES